MFNRIGTFELILIIGLALILFGPARLPQMGKAMGEAIREFKKGASELGKSIDDAGKEESSEEE